MCCIFIMPSTNTLITKNVRNDTHKCVCVSECAGVYKHYYLFTVFIKGLFVTDVASVLIL